MRSRRNTRPRDALGRPLPYGTAEATDPPAEAPVERPPAESLRAAHRLLVAGRPFEAHEVLEDAWKTRPADEREFWRGLAQLAVGITHAARGNQVGARRLLHRGAANLAAYATSGLHGVDVSAVLGWSTRAIATVAGESPVMLEAPPIDPRR